MYDGIDTPHRMQYVRYGIVAFLALGAIGLGMWYLHSKLSYTTLTVEPTSTSTSTNVIRFEVVTSQEDQERGLSGRPTIPPDYGMLFVFNVDGVYPFWMKGMLVPLDIMWLSDTGTIVHLEKFVSPDTYPNVLDPKVPARYVLEMRAGQANERGWKVGSQVTLPLPYGKSVTK